MGCLTAEDYDEYQPCFFEPDRHVDEEFYPSDNMVPTPSEDIWKKFELLPTPPRSPKHEPLGGPEIDTQLNLMLVSDKLDPPSELLSPLSSDEDNLQANLIQDCMWSAPGLLAVGLPTQVTKVREKKVCTDNAKAVGVNGTSLDIITTECVDPAAVFPYPLNDSKKAIIHGAETPSESEDDDDDDADGDDDDDDDDDSEIDVVSVTDSYVPSLNRRKLRVAMSAQVAAIHNYSSTCLSSQQPSKPRVSYSAPQTPSHHHIPGTKRPSSSPSSPPQYILSSKRTKLSETDLRHVAQKLKLSSSQQHGRTSCSSRNSSDSEDCMECEGKRAQHNVLERKRRNDLKSSFMRLRDNVPDIRIQERAPKVVILKKSADFIRSLNFRHRQLQVELEHHQQTKERLKRRLAALERGLL